VRLGAVGQDVLARDVRHGDRDVAIADSPVENAAAQYLRRGGAVDGHFNTEHEMTVNGHLADVRDGEAGFEFGERAKDRRRDTGTVRSTHGDQ